MRNVSRSVTTRMNCAWLYTSSSSTLTVRRVAPLVCGRLRCGVAFRDAAQQRHLGSRQRRVLRLDDDILRYASIAGIDGLH